MLFQNPSPGPSLPASGGAGEGVLTWRLAVLPRFGNGKCLRLSEEALSWYGRKANGFSPHEAGFYSNDFLTACPASPKANRQVNPCGGTLSRCSSASAFYSARAVHSCGRTGRGSIVPI